MSESRHSPEAQPTDAPLSGIRILDVGRIVAAPSCTQILADLGADVVKVERPGRGDELRQYAGPYLHTPDGDQLDPSYFVAFNRNKRSITVDLSNEAGQEVVRALAAQSHVFIENFKTGDLARYGLDYERLTAVNPQLVYCSVTGFGQTGPNAGRPGLDAVFQAMSGFASLNGVPDGQPLKAPVVIVDLFTGLYAAIGILAALRRSETQRAGGEHIDLALYDSAIALMSHRAMEFLVSGNDPVRLGNGTVGSAPADVFTCRDGSLNVQAGSDKHFPILCRALGMTHLLEDPRFASRQSRFHHRGELKVILEESFVQRDRAMWLDILNDAGLPCGPVLSVREALEDEQCVHRGMVRTVAHPLAGDVRMIDNPLRFREASMGEYRHSPVLGEHTVEILEDWLGYGPQEIQNLSKRGAFT